MITITVGETVAIFDSESGWMSPDKGFASQLNRLARELQEQASSHPDYWGDLAKLIAKRVGGSVRGVPFQYADEDQEGQELTIY